MGSSTTFAERLARIESRAVSGEVSAPATPGVIDESNVDSKSGRKARRMRKGRSRYMGAVLGGLATSGAIIAVSAVVLLGGLEGGSFEEKAAALLLSEN